MAIKKLIFFALGLCPLAFCSSGLNDENISHDHKKCPPGCGISRPQPAPTVQENGEFCSACIPGQGPVPVNLAPRNIPGTGNVKKWKGERRTRKFNPKSSSGGCPIIPDSKTVGLSTAPKSSLPSAVSPISLEKPLTPGSLKTIEVQVNLNGEQANTNLPLAKSSEKSVDQIMFTREEKEESSANSPGENQYSNEHENEKTLEGDFQLLQTLRDQSSNQPPQEFDEPHNDTSLQNSFVIEAPQNLTSLKFKKQRFYKTKKGDDPAIVDPAAIDDELEVDEETDEENSLVHLLKNQSHKKTRRQNTLKGFFTHVRLFKAQ